MNSIGHHPPQSSSPLFFAVPANRWSENDAAGKSGEELLLYRSNLLGSDLTVTNFGGGNTSAKLDGTDPLSGQKVRVLWVKGSGGDIGSMKLDGFSTLYLEKLLALENKYRGVEHEDEMVSYLPHCTFNLNSRAASIDTPLHAYLPFAHVDHVHPDSIIALAASSAGKAAVREIWGDKIGWFEWKRPGFDLGLRLRAYVQANPHSHGVVLAGHGVISWADSSKACYDRTINLIAEAVAYLNKKLAVTGAFGGPDIHCLPVEQRYRVAARLTPILRAKMRGDRTKIGQFSDDPEALEFVCSKDFKRLAPMGTSCPDHFLRTKIAPLMLDPAQIENDDYLSRALEDYRMAYAAYYKRCAKPTDPKMRDANPVVVLVPGVGRFTFASDKTTARIAGEFYGNAVNVMRGAQAIGEYVGLDEQEAFNIEYWALEEAKLQRMPQPRPLVGKIALVTGSAGGIGAATARRLLSDGCCVMLLDRDTVALQSTEASLRSIYGADFIRSVVCDVTDENQIRAAFDAVAVEFGGLDILVANAGIASSMPIEETTMSLWRKNYDVLADGYFLSARAAFPLMRLNGGGSIIFIGSKNGIVAASNAAAYASAKAASLHLARCLALEGAPSGIRVNVVNPDAVIKGSRIWDSNWRKERASTHGIDEGEGLEKHYRNRSLLKLDVLPEDVAEAVCFFAGDSSGKSTGNMINVDAGNPVAFTR